MSHVLAKQQNASTTNVTAADEHDTHKGALTQEERANRRAAAQTKRQLAREQQLRVLQGQLVLDRVLVDLCTPCGVDCICLCLLIEGPLYDPLIRNASLLAFESAEYLTFAHTLMLQFPLPYQLAGVHSLMRFAFQLDQHLHSSSSSDASSAASAGTSLPRAWVNMLLEDSALQFRIECCC